MLYRPSNGPELRNHDGRESDSRTGEPRRMSCSRCGDRRRVSSRSEIFIPRQTQEKLNKRLSEIISQVEPLNAKFWECLAHFCTKAGIHITLGVAPVDTWCRTLCAMVHVQDGRRMEQAALSGLVQRSLGSIYMRGTDTRGIGRLERSCTRWR
jgi:hypothetical protein